MWLQIEQALDQSMIRVLNELASLLPGMAALILAVLVSMLVAWILTSLLRLSLRGLQFDKRLIQQGSVSSLIEWLPQNSPTLLLTRIVFWSVILVGVLIGIAAFDATVTYQPTIQVFGYMRNVVAAALVLLVGNIVARFLARSVLIGAVNLNLQYARLLSAGVRWMVLVLVLAMALDHLAIGGNIVHIAFGILFGGIVLALSLAVGLGSKELVSRSLEREAAKKPVEADERFRHL
jgi:hypothetical protein